MNISKCLFLIPLHFSQKENRRCSKTLGRTSFEKQPISDRSFSRFRERVVAYELVTGVDLIHECMVSLSEHICKYMDLNPAIRRMDSMMIESNIKRMGRLELLYSCVSNLVTSLKRSGYNDKIKGLEAYADPNNRNRVVYYEKDIPQSERIQKVIDDAVKLLPACKYTHEETTDYQLLERAISEQTKDDGNGHIVPKDKGEMNATILQNPADPDATFRKIGAQNFAKLMRFVNGKSKCRALVPGWKVIKRGNTAPR